MVKKNFNKLGGGKVPNGSAKSIINLSIDIEFTETRQPKRNAI